MRVAFGVAAVLASTPAFAGGVAPIVMGGVHTEPVYVYSNRQEAGAGAPIRDPDEYEQYRTTQAIGNVGAGIEVVLGDRDDLIQGVFRGWWNLDTAQADPANSGKVEADAAVANWRDQPRNTGAGTVGIQWGVVRAAQEKFKFSLALNVGAGFITTDHTEYMLVMPGAAVSYQVHRNLEMFVELDYALRVRRELSHGGTGLAGVRVLFD